MSISTLQSWLKEHPEETAESTGDPLSDEHWQQSWTGFQRKIALRGLSPSGVSSLWLFGSDRRTGDLLDRLAAQLSGLKQIVIVDRAAQLRSHGAGVAMNWSEKYPQISLECAPVSDRGWVEQYARFASSIRAKGQHPRSCVPLDHSQAEPALAPSLKAANELLLGYGLSSGQELLEWLSTSPRCSECLEPLIEWCAYLNAIGEHLSCALLGVPLYALTLQPAMGTLLVSVFSSLGCSELALQWLGKSDLDFRARKELALVLGDSEKNGRAQAAKQRESNLKRLASKWPHLASFAESSSPAPDLYLVYTSSTPWCAPTRKGREPVAKALLPVILRVHEQSLELVANLDSAFTRQLQELDNLRFYHCVVGNIAALDVLANLELDQFDLAIPNWSKEITLFVEDPKLALMLLEVDHPAIDLFFRDWLRVVWGPGGQEAFASKIAASTSRAIPRLVAGLKPSVQRKLVDCAHRRHRVLRDYLQSTKLARHLDMPSAVLEKLERKEALKVLVPTSIHTSVLQYVAKDLCRALGQLGHQAKLLIEADGRHELSAAVWAETMQSFAPDIVILIDVLRANMDNLVPSHIPSLCWILDELPRLEDPEAIARMSDSDLSFVWGQHLVEKYKVRLGYPHCETLPFAVSPDVYFPDESIEAKDSLAYVTNVGRIGEPSDYPGLWKRLTQIFKERGHARLDVAECKELLRTLLEQGPWSLPEPERLSTLSYLACQYARWYDRVDVARSLAEAGVSLSLYGKGWDTIPELAEYSKGSVAQGAELSRVYQSHKVVLHINQNCNVHPRVLECMLAGTLVIARSNGDEDRASGGLADYLEIDREICMFEKVDDLVEKVHRAFRDEAWRREIIEAGRVRALNDHSYLARAQAMLDEFRRVLGENAEKTAVQSNELGMRTRLSSG